MKIRLNDLTPTKIKKMSLEELKELALEIRSFLLKQIIAQGGHLSSNLGVIELTIALHYVFDFQKDKLIFDTSHQSYTHKILTGRAKGFKKLKQKGGVSGLTSYQESSYDHFESGHAGNSLAALLGYLQVNKDSKNRYVALIGDGSLNSGEALSSLNLISYNNLPGIIVINNNKMSISENVGALSLVLEADFETKNQFFKTLGYDYYEVKEGHNLESLITLFKSIKNKYRPIVVEVNTIKGKGLKEAEQDKIGKYHTYLLPTDVITWSEVVQDILLKLRKNMEFELVVSAMGYGCNLLDFKEKYPDNFLDVGISEDTAATTAAGIVLANKKVILNYYSTFSQRAFDQIWHDIARPNLPVVIAIDKTGITAGDGSTHQGIMDLSLFNILPNLIILAPFTEDEAYSFFKYALEQNNHPVVIRYSKYGKNLNIKKDYQVENIDFKWNFLRKGKKINLISYGNTLNTLIEVCEESEIDANIINAKYLKPLDYETLALIFENNQPILVVEEAVNIGGLYPEILRFKEQNNYLSQVIDLNLNDYIIPPYELDEILAETGFSVEKIAKKIKKLL